MWNSEAHELFAAVQVCEIEYTLTECVHVYVIGSERVCVCVCACVRVCVCVLAITEAHELLGAVQV